MGAFSCVRLISQLGDHHLPLMSKLHSIIAILVSLSKDFERVAVGIFPEQLLDFNAHLHGTLLTIGTTFVHLDSHLTCIHGLSMVRECCIM